MATYTAQIRWERGDQAFLDNRYSRAHKWIFDGGIEVAASSSPHVVPLPMSMEAAVDPEEAFIASLSSCHMLWFLFIAARERYRVDYYQDHATANVGKNPEGKIAVLRVSLHPKVRFSGDRIPTESEHARFHHEAHEKCFIANSVKAEVTCEPALEPGRTN